MDSPSSSFFGRKKKLIEKSIYLSIDNPQPSFECYLDVVWYAHGMLVWEVKSNDSAE